MDLSLVIPCYNEADNVPILDSELFPVVRGLREARSVEVVFVDDGSTDGTGRLLAEAFGGDPLVRIVSHDRNRGLGAAIKTGFAASTGAVIVTTDSDATYPFGLIPRLLDLLDDGTDIVTASCYHPLGGVDGVPAYRLVLSRGASLLYRLAVDWSVHTYTCLFRAYRRRVLAEVPFSSDGFLSVTELLVGAMSRGFVVAELPCVLKSRRRGVSKARIARTITSHLRFLGRWITRSPRRTAKAATPVGGVGGRVQ